jgi:uncharacterized membrane protein YkvA (DUF1232 family)
VAIQNLRERARAIKRDTYALYLACRDPRTPWYAKALAAAVAAYAFSPIDLIPDFVPVLGYLDDLIIVPAGIVLAVKLIPRQVMADARDQADLRSTRPESRAVGLVIVAVWLILAALGLYLLVDRLDLI